MATFDKSKLRHPYQTTTPSPFASNLEAALYYAEHGWPVFPVKRDKTPATPHGFKDASTAPLQIESWWERDPDYGVGCPAGRESGFFVLDLDVKGDGPQQFSDLLQRYNGGVDLFTRQSKTGGGGYHHFFLYPEARNITNSSGSLPSGMDVRGEGGYVVLPPSAHSSGSRYEWIRTDDLQPAPEWLVELVTTKPDKGVERPNRTGDETIIPEGTRNNTLMSVAGRLCRIGLDEDEISAALVAFAARRCEGDFPEEECRSIARSVARYKPDRDLEQGLENAHQNPGLVWHTAKEIGAMDLPEPSFLAWPLFGAGMVSIIAGKWKSAGKTTMTLSAIRAMLESEPFLGKPTTRTPVVYLYEGSEREFQTSLADAHLTDPAIRQDLHVLLRSQNIETRWPNTIKGALQKAIEVGAM